MGPFLRLQPTSYQGSRTGNDVFVSSMDQVRKVEIGPFSSKKRGGYRQSPLRRKGKEDSNGSNSQNQLRPQREGEVERRPQGGRFGQTDCLDPHKRCSPMSITGGEKAVGRWMRKAVGELSHITKSKTGFEGEGDLEKKDEDASGMKKDDQERKRGQQQQHKTKVNYPWNEFKGLFWILMA